MSWAGSVLLEDPTYSTTCKAELRYIRTLPEHPAFPVHNLNSMTSGAFLDMSIYIYIYICIYGCIYSYIDVRVCIPENYRYLPSQATLQSQSCILMDRHRTPLLGAETRIRCQRLFPSPPLYSAHLFRIFITMARHSFTSFASCKATLHIPVTASRSTESSAGLSSPFFPLHSSKISRHEVRDVFAEANVKAGTC